MGKKIAKKAAGPEARRRETAALDKVLGDIEAKLYPWIASGLRVLAEPIEKLKRNPKNPVTHDEANIEAIAASLKEYGQRVVLVVNRRTGQIEKGNGTFEAARRLGWSHVAVLWVEEDTGRQQGFALADNRTAEFSEWNQAGLDDLLADLQKELPDLCDALALEELTAEPIDDGETEGESEASGEEQTPEIWEVVVTCNDEESQKAFYERMQKEGHKCRLLML